MKKLLLSAFACDPTKGSEAGNGWNCAVELAKKGYEVHCFTRSIAKREIERGEKPGNLHFHYIDLSLNLEKLYNASQATMYLYYLIWQWKTYKVALRVHKAISFSIAHHVTWGSLQMGSFLYKLGIPLVFGPAGGGQIAPKEFKGYFKEYWKDEQQRETLTKWMLKYSPACKKMLENAAAILVANKETFQMAVSNGVAKPKMMLDVALPETFFPESRPVKQPEKNRLKLLWVGRFFPRKGLLLVLDVMKELKEYPGITLTVVGDGEMKNHFLAAIKKYGLEETVKWEGRVSHEKVREYYAAHDIFFYTSLRDSGSSQIVEAMAFGLPVVTLNLHGQALLVEDDRGIRCLCNTPNDAIENLKQAMLGLYSNPEKVKNMSEAAYEFARKQTWKNKVEAIIAEYQSILFKTK
jgi:glycosyltransferase involved in cell wall biosynthesis